ncbi:membrane protein [Saccharibacillus endophyticus]|uniref:Membrane protein n=1 Tax=Saccharibacillus endophyticus TaxID=2060666 RepID=A0ABQ1ZMF8_9BACL|nr:membrane protein [Saccharibacillus endophyticus]
MSEFSSHAGSRKQPAREIGNSRSRSLVSGILFGVGCIAFIDEVVFHQLLHWHHFYDLSTTGAGLVSDGLLHAFSWFASVASLFMLADLRRKRAWFRSRWIGGVLLGAGFFQLYDGIVHHKLMQIHQIRYGVDLTAYDWSWNIAGALLLIAGIIMTIRTGREKTESREGASARE